MRITVIKVGKAKDRAVSELAAGYGKRLGRGAGIEWIEVPQASGRTPPPRAMAREAESIRKRIPPGAYVVALSEGGRRLDSRSFAAWLGSLRDQGRQVCFLIGGVGGLDAGLVDEADEVISLSPLTFPHELVVVILAEQVYRAFSILEGSPYHRD